MIENDIAITVREKSIMILPLEKGWIGALKRKNTVLLAGFVPEYKIWFCTDNI